MFELKASISVMNFKKIGKIAHSIKGASANFRLENIQSMSDELEKMAKKEERKYNYMNMFENIKIATQAIKIV